MLCQLAGAGPIDPFEKLFGVPEVLVGGRCTVGEPWGTVLVVERASPWIDRAVGQPGYELVKLSRHFRRETITALPANSARVWVVDV